MSAVSPSNPRAAVERAVLFLAGRCDGAVSQDGQGFNRYDAYWGHEAADRIAAGQEVNPVHALRVVSKYRRQLTAAGIELPRQETILAIVEAAKVARAAEQPQGVTVGRVGNGATLAIRFPYDPALVDKARSLPKRKWDPASKAWTVPDWTLDAVLRAFPAAQLAPELAAEVAARESAAAAAKVELAARVERDLAAYAAGKTDVPLFDHQNTGARWLIEQRKAILADDMGLGKTRQALLAAKAVGHRVFVIAPAGLRINWLREAEQVRVPIEFFSWAKVPAPPEVAFTLIADEAHYAQNLRAARTKRFLALAKAAEAVFALTGTPIKNGRPANLYPLLLATDHALALDKRSFDIRYCAAGPTRWSAWDTTGATNLEELHRKIADGVLRRMKDECLDLPAKLRVTKKAELSEAAQSTYNAELARLQGEYRRRKETGELQGEADALVLLNHLRHAGSVAKVEAAVELAEEVLEQGGQVVLFTAFLDSAAAIAEALNAGRITGEQDAVARQTAIDAFQAGLTRAIVCTLGAGNVGITLTAAQTVILVDRPWTPGDAVQAEDRLHRIGQRSAVTAVWLQANGADEAIDALLQQKHERIELALAGQRKSLRGIATIGDVAEAVLG